MPEEIYKKPEEIIGPEPKMKMLKDAINGEDLRWTPEEEIRQIFINKLIKEYRYPKKLIKKEVSVRSGQTETKKRADIVVYRDDSNFEPETNAYIIVETKKKDRSDGVDQLETYLNVTTAEFGIWFNGKEYAFIQQTREPHKHFGIPDIPPYGETLADVGLYQKKDLIPAADLRSDFEASHNYIYANEGYLKEQVFNEVLKLIFVKMVDERSASADCQFRITEKELRAVENGKGQEFRERIEGLFKKVQKQYHDIFKNDELRLKIHSMAYVVSRFQKYDFRKTPIDIKGAAFQAFVHAHSRGERGEFFTPHPILRLVINMLDPKDDESILDPACGSGGFLVETLKHVREQFEQAGLENFDLIDAVRSYAHTYIRGIDFNPDLARVSKMYMVLNDDGHTGIFSENSLEDIGKILATTQGKIDYGSFDLVMTNPPFGSKGKVTNKQILSLFDLGHKWKKENDTWKMEVDKLMSQGNGEGGQVPDILFIERCLQFLKEGGRMAIVLPDGDLTNSSLQYVRGWIKNYARILAVVSLPPETFVPFGAGVKASVLFLQKLPKEELEKLKKKDYPIFMAIIEKIGYDIRGRTVFKRDEEGKVIKDENDNPVVDEDVSEIIEEFEKFKEKNKLEF